MILAEDRMIPEGYSLDVTLIEILVERYKDFDIFWYHWPRDGMFPVEDYEPVIIVYSDNNLCSVAVRNHWRFNPSVNSVQNIPIPVRILFDPTQHSPSVATNSINYRIVPHIARRLRNYLTNIDGSRISDMFRIGLKHPSNIFNRTFEDPARYTGTLFKEFCQNNLT